MRWTPASRSAAADVSTIASWQPALLLLLMGAVLLIVGQSGV
jgi:hypothetical protein